MTDSMLTYNKKGQFTGASGPDAVNLVRAGYLWQGIKGYIETNGRMIPTRGVTITKMLKMAEGYTGKTYKLKDKQKAADDLKAWMDTMKLALPSEVK